MAKATIELRKWTIFNGAQLRALISQRALIVTAAPRKGNLERMPLVPANVRFPGRKVRLDRAMVTAVTRDGLRCKLEMDNCGMTFWVDVSLLTFNVDTI